MKNNIQYLTLVGLLTALIIVTSQIIIPIGIIPITLQTLIIGIVASTFGVRVSLLSVLLYLTLGAIGLPVFAGFKGGIVVLLGPTGGYLISFILVAIIQPLLLKISKNIFNLVFVNIIGQFLSLIIGTFFMTLILHIHFSKAMLLGFYPFVIPTIIKIFLIVIIVVSLLKINSIKKISSI